VHAILDRSRPTSSHNDGQTQRDANARSELRTSIEQVAGENDLVRYWAREGMLDDAVPRRSSQEQPLSPASSRRSKSSMFGFEHTLPDVPESGTIKAVSPADMPVLPARSDAPQPGPSNSGGDSKHTSYQGRSLASRVVPDRLKEQVRIGTDGSNWKPSILDRLKSSDAKNLATILSYAYHQGKDQSVLIFGHQKVEESDKVEVTMFQEEWKNYRKNFDWSTVKDKYVMPNQEYELIEKTYLSKRKFQYKANTTEDYTAGW
jgi:hypothetical protein